MAWSDPFLLGPLGGMRPLPSPPHGEKVSAAPVRRGGVHEPLLGPAVEDIWSTRRRWELPYAERQAAELRALTRQWYGLGARRPLRLLDPMWGPNLLSIDASATGALSRTLAAFNAGPRPMTFVPSLDLPAELEDCSGLLRWAVPQNVADAVRADEANPVPVLKRAVTVSLFARGAGQVAAQVEPVNIDGTAQAASIRSAFITLTATWQPLSVTLPAGSAAAGAYAALSVASGAARTVETCGWQAEHGTTRTRWELGGACPRVRLAGFDPAYQRLNRRSGSSTLEEV